MMQHTGGVRKRTANTADGPGVADGAPDHVGPPRRGGVRQRVGSDLRGSVSSAPVVAESSSFRGGVRHRLLEPGSTSTSSHLPLFRSLKRDWARGKITSAQVQEYAAGASAAGAPSLGALAGAGQAGTRPGNLFRSLVSAFGMPPGAPEFFWADIPVAGQKDLVPQPFILPHMLFHSLFKHRPMIWKNDLRGPDRFLCEFWRNNQRIVDLHGAMDKPNLPKTVPLGVHGDAGAISNHESVLAISWNSIAANEKAKTLAKRFLFTVIKSSSLRPDGSTLEAIWGVFSWSMNALLSGRMPTKDYKGRCIAAEALPIADGWCGALVQFRGDCFFFQEALGVPRHNEMNNMCWLCAAGGREDSILWTDFSENARWRDTRRDHAAFCENLRARGKTPSALFDTIGFKSEFILIDVLHAVDLGIASHIIANIFVEVMQLKHWGPNLKLQTDGLASALADWYRQNKDKHRIQGKLSIDRIRTRGGWPKLKAKGAATRHLSHFALHLAQQYDSGSLHDKQRIAVVQLLVRFYTILECEGVCLSPHARTELPKVGFRLCNIYAKLAHEAVEQGRMKWKLVPKFHLFQHLTEWQTVDFGNPRFWWCYPDEDLIGHLIEVAGSTHPRTMPLVSLFKWLTFFFDGLLDLDKDLP